MQSAKDQLTARLVKEQWCAAALRLRPRHASVNISFGRASGQPVLACSADARMRALQNITTTEFSKICQANRLRA